MDHENLMQSTANNGPHGFTWAAAPISHSLAPWPEHLPLHKPLLMHLFGLHNFSLLTHAFLLLNKAMPVQHSTI